MNTETQEAIMDALHLYGNGEVTEVQLVRFVDAMDNLVYCKGRSFGNAHDAAMDWPAIRDWLLWMVKAKV